MKVETRIFGTVDIDESKIITFPGGIVGFPDLTKFAIIHDEETGVNLRRIMDIRGVKPKDIQEYLGLGCVIVCKYIL